jgi:F-type H+-transporting ATPase subunit epsilon
MINLKIVTPGGSVYEDLAISVTIPTTSGYVTILDNHIPLISVVKSGEIIITKETKDQKSYEVAFAVSSGVLEVEEGSVVNIMAETVEVAENIDLERAKNAKEKAEEILKNINLSDDDQYRYLVAKIEKELARINVSNKYRKI